MICFVTNNHSERAMPRLMLTDEQWSKLHSIMLESGRIYNKSDHRNTVEGILYRMRVGCPWRDLPDSFGRWNTIFRRFNLWSKKGIIAILFNELSKETDTEWEFLDGSIVKAHQHCAGPASGGLKRSDVAVVAVPRRSTWRSIVMGYRYISSYRVGR